MKGFVKDVHIYLILNGNMVAAYANLDIHYKMGNVRKIRLEMMIHHLVMLELTLTHNKEDV